MASFFQSLNADDDQITDTAKNNPRKIRPRRTPFYVESDFFKNSRFTTTN